MEWQEQLQILLEDVEALDVRYICIKQNEEWYLKHLRATRYSTEPTVPEQICYSSHLFLREFVSAGKFLQLVSNLAYSFIEDKNLFAADYALSSGDISINSTSEEVERVFREAKRRKLYEIKGFTIHLGTASISLSGHAPGYARWGLGHSTLPSWNFNGNFRPEISVNYEPLVAKDAPFFPTAQAGEAWFLYNKSLQSGQVLFGVDIKIEDARAFFSGIDIKGDICTVRCQGKYLSETIINLYTPKPQVEAKLADVTI